jgi:hypothetical protein
MHLLRLFLILTSVPDLRPAQAQHGIRVLIQRQQPLSRPSIDNRAALCRTAHTANPAFSRPSQSSCDPNCRSNPIAHRVRRKRHPLPPSLLIENASDQFHFVVRVLTRGVSDQA